MKKTELQAKSIKALKALALSLGIKRPTTGNKNDLIAEIEAAERVNRLKDDGVKKGVSTKTASKTTKSSQPPEPITRASETLRRTTIASRKRRTTSATPPPASPSVVPPAAVEHKYETPSHPIPFSTVSPYDHLGELPEAYGTGKLFLTARDPHWLYAYWDFTWQQLEEIRCRANYGEIKLRVYSGKDPQAPLHQEIILNPAARNWFIQVNQPNAHYCGELGYYNHEGKFISLSRSVPTHTPPDRMSERTEARFVTIPFHITFRELYEMVKAYFKHGEELADVLHRLQEAGFRFPFEYDKVNGQLIGEQALSELFGQGMFRQIRMGSEVVTEWLQRRMQEEVSSGIFSVSSPFGASFGAFKGRGFWVNVNAELIVYGATEPQAQVVFDGKKIALKPDGTFRFQFALPDGSFKIPIKATSPDRIETREVNLHFVRQTAEQGGVGIVPFPEGLTTLTPATA